MYNQLQRFPDWGKSWLTFLSPTRVRIDTLPELIEWVHANRFVRELTCTERANFNIQPLCESP